MKEKGLIHIYCGDGKGKTTAAMGLALRATGSGKKVLIVQFFKDGTSSEIDVLRQIPGITVLVDTTDYGFFWKMNEEQKANAKKGFQVLLEQAIKQSEAYDVLILDEIISTYNHEMILPTTLLTFLKGKKNSLEVIMTGRDPKSELVDLADYVSEVKKLKHPFDQGVGARLGIEY